MQRIKFIFWEVTTSGMTFNIFNENTAYNQKLIELDMASVCDLFSFSRNNHKKFCHWYSR
jgi:hypothetical protein